MKRRLFGIALLVSIAIAACFSASAKAGEVVKIGHNEIEGHPVHQAFLLFGRELEEKTQGRYTVEIFPNAVLGNDTTMVEQLQAGLLQFMKVSSSFLDSFASTYGILSIPYLFESEEHFHRVMGSDIIKPILESGIDSGILGLSYFNSGSRSFYTTSKPILSPADLAGMKIRVMPSPIAIRMIQLLGAHATPLPYGDVYTALQQGLLDGAENSEMALIDMKHGEVAKHFSYDMHTIIPDMFIVNADFWAGLSDGDRAIFAECVAKATQKQLELWASEIEHCKKEAAEKLGVKFYDVEKGPFQEAVKPILDEAMADPGKAGIIQAIIAAR